MILTTTFYIFRQPKIFNEGRRFVPRFLKMADFFIFQLAAPIPVIQQQLQSFQKSRDQHSCTFVAPSVVHIS